MLELPFPTVSPALAGLLDFASVFIPTLKRNAFLVAV